MELMDNGRWWIGPTGERYCVIAGAADEPAVIEDAPPADAPPDEPPTPTAEEDAARLREENARLRGENTALRETRREPEPPRRDTPPAADPHVAEFTAIEAAFQKGEITDAERVMRLGALGAEAALTRRDKQAEATAAKTRDDQARAKGGQKIRGYLDKYPGLSNAAGPEMQRVLPHLRAVVDEFGFDDADPRAQVLALERTFGPIDRSPHVDTREFERRRHPGGGGGGTFGEESPPPAKPKSKGEDIFNRLLPEFQTFYLTTRGSKEAAIKTLEHADELQMRKQGRFR